VAQRYIVESDGADHEAEVNRRGGGLDVTLDGTLYRVRLIPEGPPAVYLLTVTGSRHEVGVERGPSGLRVVVGGRRYNLGVFRHGQRRQAAPSSRGGRSERESGDGTWTLLCPMTGLIRSIEVEEGQRVEPNDVLLVIEAMKMNNELRAVRPSIIRKIHVLPGDRMDQGADLITFEPVEETEA
jgi:propionyl-CoA carboxylase alpha chain